MIDLDEGDLVEVTITNLKITDPLRYTSAFRGVNPFMQYSTRTSAKTNEIFFDMGKDITVRKTGSGSAFKPQAGDVYQAEGKLWYAVREGTEITLEDSDGKKYSNELWTAIGTLKAFERKNPKLVMRDGKRTENKLSTLTFS